MYSVCNRYPFPILECDRNLDRCSVMEECEIGESFHFWKGKKITFLLIWQGSDADLTLSASEQWRIVLLLSNCVALWPLMIYSTDLICCMIVGSCFIKIFSLITTSLYILELERSMPAVDDEIAEVGFNDVRPCDAA